MNNCTKGLMYGIMAAFLNGIVGVLSVSVFKQGASPYLVSFYKCLFATLLLLLFVLLSKRIKTLLALSKNLVAIAICGFLGFFLLFFFETIAYSHSNVTTVVFTLFASAIITTFLAKSIIEKRLLNKSELISALFALVGILLFSNYQKLIIDPGLIYSAFAGIGYGLFMVYSRKLNIKATVEYLTALLFFASIYLSIPFFYTHGLTLPTLESLPIILLLAILPTIGGFFCTIKSLSYISSSQVIVIEISELLFASILALVFLSQKPSLIELLGGMFIILSIVLSIQITNKVL